MVFPLRGSSLTRAEMAVFLLLRAEHGAGYTSPAVTGTRFSDVPDSYWAADWIEQLAAEGITAGCGGTYYCPESPVTREQFAIFALRTKFGSAFNPGTFSNYSSPYTDITNSYAKNWIQYLASGLGITDYCSAGAYCPAASLTRERLAYLLVRVFNLPLAYTPLPAGAPFGDDKGRVRASASDVGDWRTGDWRDTTVAAVPHATMTMPEARIIDPTYHAPKVLAVPDTLTVSAAFLYDGDGRRVAQTLNGVTTYFVGNYYEVTGSVGTQQHIVTKYYFAGSTRVAMRTDDDAAPGTTLNFLLSDHLGSTSLTSNASGSVVSELRYKPWGEVRYSAGSTPTKYQYTGQMSYTSEFGLMYYNARWYDPYLNRFAQADSIIPGAGNSQAWDRYA